MMLKIGFRSLYTSMAATSLVRQLSTHIGRLEGKVALITGAASGIGKEAATKFISNGAKVVLVDIQSELGHHTAAELGPNASFIACNVAQESDVSNAVDFAVSKHGQLDIMYNNAGVVSHYPPSIVDLDLERFEQVMAINVRGVLAGIKHATRVMVPRQRGSILCTASVGGMVGGLGPHPYCISKSTVIGIVKSLAAELCTHGIRINCISPFAIATPLMTEYMQMLIPGVKEDEVVRTAHKTSVLKGAVCEAEDIANAAVYLASDDAKYVSGHNLVVDGGFSSFKTLDLTAPSQVH